MLYFLRGQPCYPRQAKIASKIKQMAHFFRLCHAASLLPKGIPCLSPAWDAFAERELYSALAYVPKGMRGNGLTPCFPVWFVAINLSFFLLAKRSGCVLIQRAAVPFQFDVSRRCRTLYYNDLDFMPPGLERNPGLARLFLIGFNYICGGGFRSRAAGSVAGIRINELEAVHAYVGLAARHLVKRQVKMPIRACIRDADVSLKFRDTACGQGYG